MKLIIKAKPNSKKPSIEKTEDGIFIVAVKEKPENDRANQAVIRALADYLGIAVSRVAIVMGRTSKKKIIEIK